MAVKEGGACAPDLNDRHHEIPAMATVLEHYATHLGPIYLWMAGGFDQAVEAGRSDIRSLGVPIRASTPALDLGAGFGMHAIPLAELGCSVTALDSSAILLDELMARRQRLPISAVECDLLQFDTHVRELQSLVLCMGDTLTHLQSCEEVELLFAKIAKVLTPNGAFAATFRDYSAGPVGLRRFIPVRSDQDRIHTCMLETGGTHMTVCDILHERVGETWNLRVSDYQKLRLSPAWVLGALQDVGLHPQASQGPRGMIQVVARAA